MVYFSSLGEHRTTATSRLLRQLLYSFADDRDMLNCFRCGSHVSLEDFSIDHKDSWSLAPDPKAAFFDLNNIAFSHLSCNSLAGAGLGSSRKTHCPQGHEYTEENTSYDTSGGSRSRKCRACKRAAYRTRKLNASS